MTSNSLVRSNSMKPILKFNQHNNLQQSQELFNNSSLASDRSASMSSTDSTNEPVQMKTLKLPPIVKCSDDFYAVLRDLEHENEMII